MARALVDLPTFRSRHLLALEKDQARFNLLLGLLASAEKNPAKARLWSFGSDARCAAQTPPRLIVLGELSADDAQELAAEVAGAEFAGCIGTDQAPELFARALSAHGIQLKMEMPQRIYRLNSPPVFPNSEGVGRKARAEDLELFVDWLIAFWIETELPETPPARDRLLALGLSHPVFFWEVEGQPVAMASRNRETKSGSNISLVYTLPEFRGRGFGGSVTAFACQEVFAEGKTEAFLYTDLRNPISNRVYQKIGFRPHCDAFTFVRRS